MAKSSKKSKKKTSRNGATKMPKQQANTFATPEEGIDSESGEHEDEHEFSDETEAAEAADGEHGDTGENGDAKEPKYKPADYDRARPLIDEMFEAEKEVLRREAQLEQSRDDLTKVVLELRDAMGGRSGPFTINGERIQLRLRGKTGYFTVETATTHPTFETSVARAPRKSEQSAQQHAAE